MVGDGGLERPQYIYLDGMGSEENHLVIHLLHTTIFNIDPVIQDKSKEIRYSKKLEFNEEVVKNYFNKQIDLKSKQFDISLLKEPFFLYN